MYKYFAKIFIKIENILGKVKNTFIYHKALESYNLFLTLKTKIINNDFFVILFNYKNSLFLKDVEKVKLFLNEFIFDKVSTVYKRNLFLINLLYVKYLENFLIIIKNNIKIFMEKYYFLEKKFNLYIENKEVSNKNNYILKQNKFISYHSIVSLLGSRQRNKIYAANSSLWPVFLSIFAGIFVLLFVCVLHNQNFLSFLNKQLLIAIFGGAISISFWITTFYKEKQLGFHTYEVRRNIRLGFYIFIFTEAICFLSLFWTFLHALLAASLNIGLHNPGEGIVHFWMTETKLFHPYWERFYYLENQKALLINLTDHSVYRNKKVFDKNLVVKVHINLHDKGQLINPYKYPLMNTFILLASACSLNASHTQIKMGKYLTALLLLLFTIVLGLAFAFIQYKEIRNCSIQFTDGIYGSCFYSLTGLHGTHVILGIFGLFICFLNFLKHNYSQKRHDTYWFAILYWHFVDIIWILVYLIIYIWPSFYFHRSGVRWVQLDYNSYCFNFSQEAFENTLYYKLYNDRTKLNHSLINYAVLKLDNDNLFKNNQDIVFNYEKQNEVNYKEINGLNTKFINLFIENKNQFKRALKETYLNTFKNEKNFNETKKINSLKQLFNLDLNANNFFYNDVLTRKPIKNFTNKHLILLENIYVDYLLQEEKNKKTKKKSIRFVGKFLTKKIFA